MPSATIKFPREMNFTGRNGYFRQAGIEIMVGTQQNVMLSPMTSKWQPGRCDMEIPYESLPMVIAALSRALAHIETQTA